MTGWGCRACWYGWCSGAAARGGWATTAGSLEQGSAGRAGLATWVGRLGGNNSQRPDFGAGTPSRGQPGPVGRPHLRCWGSGADVCAAITLRASPGRENGAMTWGTDPGPPRVLPRASGSRPRLPTRWALGLRLLGSSSGRQRSPGLQDFLLLLGLASSLSHFLV